MANILYCPSNCFKFSEFDYALGNFDEQIIDELVSLGNSVLVYNGKELNSNIYGGDNSLKNNLCKKHIEEQIKSFNPDLIFAFNNTTYKDILTITNCKILVFNSDSLQYWNQKEQIKSNLDRYVICSFSDNLELLRNYSDYFNIPLRDINIVKLATSIKNESLNQDKNISFIGTRFPGDYWTTKIISDCITQKEISWVQNMLHKIKLNPYISKEEFYIDDLSANIKKHLDNIFSFVDVFAGEDRVHTLLNIYDLGLYLYGSNNWLDDWFVASFPGLCSRFVKCCVFTKQHNQDIYNSSKICLNVMHPQSIVGMPYRVLDIMASNGCLVTGYSTMIDSEFSKYVKLPFFSNPYEARSVCQNILNDEKYRAELISICNDIVEKKYRWKYRFEEISNICNVKLLNNDVSGGLNFVKAKYINFKNNKEINIKNRIRIALYTRLKRTLDRKGLI